MSMNTNSRKRTLFTCTAAAIAALYVALTYASAALGLASYAIQVRFSEALCILPFFTPAAIPGCILGCFLSNLLLGALWQDVIFGTLATAIGVFGAFLCRRLGFWAVPFPTVLANTLILPPVLLFAYGLEGGLAYFALTIGIGELLSVGGLGTLLYFGVQKHAHQLFGTPARTPKKKG